MNRTLPRLALLVFAGLAGAALALPEDRDQPIRISADRAEVDDATGIATYRGDVRMDQGTLSVTADTLVIETEDESVTRITARGAADGEPARYRQLPAKDEEPVEANAATIVYLTTDERIELDGNARLSQAEDRFEGDRIVYDLRAQTVAATSTREDSRVNFTIRPERIPGAGRAAETAAETAAESAEGMAAQEAREGQEADAQHAAESGVPGTDVPDTEVLDVEGPDTRVPDTQAPGTD